MGASSSTRAPRRPTTEIRALLLDAAQELFASNGYEATRLKDISERAGVAAQLIFTNFGSKAGLFEAAIVEPFSKFMTEYVSLWGQHDPTSSFEQRIAVFVERIYDLAARDRKLLIFSLAQRMAETNNSDTADDLPNRLATVLQTLQPVLAARAPERGFPDPDPALLVAASAAMVLGMALLDDLLFPAGTPRPDRGRITTDLTTLLVNAFPPSPESAGRPPTGQVSHDRNGRAHQEPRRNP
jgi:AcrR family transcriptional regulator